MQAAVLPNVHVTVVCAPYGEFAAEQLTVKNMPKRQIVRRGDRIPRSAGHQQPQRLARGRDNAIGHAFLR